MKIVIGFLIAGLVVTNIFWVIQMNRQKQLFGPYSNSIGVSMGVSSRQTPQPAQSVARYSQGFGVNQQIVLGWNATSDYQRTIVLGDNAIADKDYQLVIIFDDGTEWRKALPKGKWVALSPIE